MKERSFRILKDKKYKKTSTDIIQIMTNLQKNRIWSPGYASKKFLAKRAQEKQVKRNLSKQLIKQSKQIGNRDGNYQGEAEIHTNII